MNPCGVPGGQSHDGLAEQARVRTRGLTTLHAPLPENGSGSAISLLVLPMIRMRVRWSFERGAIVQPCEQHSAGIGDVSRTWGLKVRVICNAHDILPRHPLSTAVRCLQR